MIICVSLQLGVEHSMFNSGGTISRELEEFFAEFSEKSEMKMNVSLSLTTRPVTGTVALSSNHSVRFLPLTQQFWNWGTCVFRMEVECKNTFNLFHGISKIYPTSIKYMLKAWIYPVAASSSPEICRATPCGDYCAEKCHN